MARLLLKNSTRLPLRQLPFLRLFSTSAQHHQSLHPFFTHPLPPAPHYPSNLLVDEGHLWLLSTKPYESDKPDQVVDGHGVDEESSFGFDEIDDMRLRRKLFYKIDRDSKEYDECSIKFYKTKSARNKKRVPGRPAAEDPGPFGGEIETNAKKERSKRGMDAGSQKSKSNRGENKEEERSNLRLADRSVRGCYSVELEKSEKELNCSEEKWIRSQDQHSTPRMVDRGARDCGIDESGIGRCSGGKFKKSNLGSNGIHETIDNNVEPNGVTDRCCSSMEEARDRGSSNRHLRTNDMDDAMMVVKRVRTPTYNQTTDPYHQPFCLDIHITKASVRACVVHRVTSRVVVVAHSISKDMKFDLKSRKDSRACAAVGAALAQRAMADDIHNVVYTPRKGEKIEDKLLVVLQAIVDRGINVKVKLKKRRRSRFKKEATKEEQQHS